MQPLKEVFAIILLAVAFVGASAILLAPTVADATCAPGWNLSFGANHSTVKLHHKVKWEAVVSTTPGQGSFPPGCPLTDVNVTVTLPDGVTDQVATNANVPGDGGSVTFHTTPYKAAPVGPITATVVGSGSSEGNEVSGSSGYTVEVKR